MPGTTEMMSGGCCSSKKESVDTAQFKNQPALTLNVQTNFVKPRIVEKSP